MDKYEDHRRLFPRDEKRPKTHAEFKARKAWGRKQDERDGTRKHRMEWQAPEVLFREARREQRRTCTCPCSYACPCPYSWSRSHSYSHSCSSCHGWRRQRRVLVRLLVVVGGEVEEPGVGAVAPRREQHLLGRPLPRMPMCRREVLHTVLRRAECERRCLALGHVRGLPPTAAIDRNRRDGLRVEVRSTMPSRR